jgi:hypothetical protein
VRINKLKQEGYMKRHRYILAVILAIVTLLMMLVGCGGGSGSSSSSGTGSSSSGGGSSLLGTTWLLWSGNGPWTGYSNGLIDFYLTINSNGSLSASSAQCDLYAWCGSGTFIVSGTVSGNTINNFSITGNGSQTNGNCTESYSFSVTGTLTTPNGENMTLSGNATDSMQYSALCGSGSNSGTCAGNCLIGDIKQ